MKLHVAPAGTPAPTTETPGDPWEEIALQYGATPEQAAGFARAMQGQYSPKRELLWRVNERLQGRDPGKPANWRGLQ